MIAENERAGLDWNYSRYDTETPFEVLALGSIVPFIREAAFGPDAIDAMSKAYDKARRSLHDRGQPAIVQEVIARRIVALAASGERDPDKLSVMALDVLGIDTSRF